MTVIDGANAHGAGLGLAPAFRAQHRRFKLPSVAPYERALYLAVLPHTGGVLAVPQAHAHAA